MTLITIEQFNELCDDAISPMKAAKLDMANKKSFGAARAPPADDPSSVPVGDTTFVACGTQVESKSGHVGTVPAKRLGTIEEFGAVCAFLCSRQAAYMTAQAIAVDGAVVKTML